jgi:FixJ family two-component response regulator
MQHVDGSIVIVDDDEDMRRALARLLTAAGLRTATFESAEALPEAGVAADAHCLILDVQLPGRSGLDLREELHARGVDRPVIFITAFDDVESRVRAHRAGAVAYFSKPFPGSSLLLALARTLEA